MSRYEIRISVKVNDAYLTKEERAELQADPCHFFTTYGYLNYTDDVDVDIVGAVEA